MLTRANLTANPHFTLHPPAADTAIDAAVGASSIPFPPEYRALLRLTNGLSSDGCLVLYAAEDPPPATRTTKSRPTCRTTS